MRSPLTMFREKRNGADEWSMTRVVVWGTACTANLVMLVLAKEGQNPGWPLAFVLFASMFALPFKDLFQGGAGAALLTKLLERFGAP